MKRKLSLSLLFATLILMTSITSSHAFWNRDVKKAKEFMKIDMYQEAIELLKKRINEKPSDAETHYLLGTCYLQRGSYSSADKSFERAVKLKPDYAKKIGKEYKEIGEKHLYENNFTLAESSFERAVKFNPGFSYEIGDLFYDVGKNYFDNNNYRISQRLFLQAVKYNTELKLKINEIKKIRRKKYLVSRLKETKTRKIKIALQPETYDVNGRKMDEWAPLFQAAALVNASVSELTPNESYEKYDIIYWSACEGKYRRKFFQQVDTLIKRGKFLILGGSNSCLGGPNCKFVKGKAVNCITAAERANEILPKYNLFLTKDDPRRYIVHVVGSHPLVNEMTEFSAYRVPYLKVLRKQNVTILAKANDKIVMAIYEDNNTGGSILASGYTYSMLLGVYVPPKGKYDPSKNPGTKDYRILELIKNIVKYQRMKEVKRLESEIANLR